MDMKKMIITLSVMGIVMSGCSTKQTSKVVTPSPQKNTTKVESTDIELMFEKAIYLQKQRKYSQAIEVYSSIIHQYSNSEYKSTIESAYINMFECSLLSDREFRLTDVKSFLEKFGKNRASLMELELLHILNQAKKASVDSKVEKWSSEYSGYKLDGWTFMYIDDWAKHIEQTKVRNRLQRYIRVFKKFL